MKLINKSIYVLSLAGMLGLWSCTADEEMAGMENSGKQIPVTITVSRAAMPDTRTVLTEDGNGNLTDVWSEADQLALVDATGEQVGTLEFQEYVSVDNKSTAVFEGTMNATGEGTKPYRIWYLGAGGSPYSKFATFTNGGNETFNCVQTILSAQSGKFEDLVKGDLMHAVVDLNIQENHAVVEKSVTMTKLLAMARFSLKEAASVTNGKLTITSSNTSGSNQLYYRLSYYCKDAEIAESMASASEFITIENVNTSNDVYVVLPTVKDFHLTFTLTSGNDTWTYTTAGTNTLEAGKYYCNADGTGIRIALEKEQEEEVVDHSKNPLLKWAEADLVYNKNTKTNSIADSYTTQGSLYQWGRNTGWSNYKDAMGIKTYNYMHGYVTYDHTYKTGTGIYNGNDHKNRYSYDGNADFYYKDGNGLDWRTMFFMNPNATDYWIGSGGGNTWDERAKLCGFTASVCPEGWCMPVEADFLEIKPLEPKKGTGDLSSVLNNLVELKRIEGVCTYAMRWSAVINNSKTYLRIDALVVPDNFSTDNLSSINWSDENVVTRYFGSNGMIHAFYHVNITNIGNFPVARPMPGVETHEDKTWTDTGYTTIGYFNYWTVLWNNIKDYSVNNAGYYWMSDKKAVFTFEDNTRVKSVYHNGYPFADRQSVLGTLSVNAQDCYSIRCVKDE